MREKTNNISKDLACNKDKTIILHSPKLFETGFRLNVITGKCISLYSLFKKLGYEISFIDENHKNINQESLENFLENNPRLSDDNVIILTFLSKTDAYGPVLKKIAKRLDIIKEKYPCIRIYAFGYLAISALNDLLEYTKIDGILTYDGIVSKEKTFTNDLSQIVNSKLNTYSSLKDIPEAYFENKKDSIISIDGSYGCRGHCSFCAYNMDISSGWTKLNLDLAAQDIKFLYHKYGMHRFAFTDNDFGGSKEECIERSQTLYDQLRDIKNNISISLNIRSETLTRKSIDLLSGAGVKVFLIGVESFHPKNIKKIYGKSFCINHLYDIVSYADQKGIQVVSSYILWHAWQTIDDIKYEVEEIIRYGRFRIPQFIANSIVRVMPGTSMEEKLRRNGLLIGEPFDRHFNFQDLNVRDLYRKVQNNFEDHIKPTLRNLNENNKEDIRKVSQLKIDEFNWFLSQL